jgi:hypothetical protein
VGIFLALVDVNAVGVGLLEATFALAFKGIFNIDANFIVSAKVVVI